MSEAIISASESLRLAELEEVIEKGIGTFIKVGEALAEIKTGKLYRGTYGSFEAYCREEWSMSRYNAFDLIETSKAAKNVEEVQQITREQARPLAALKQPEQQRQALQSAVEKANGSQPTAKQVAAAVEEVKAEAQPKRERVPGPSNGMKYATMAMENLKMIQPNDTERDKAFLAVQRFITQNHKPQ